MSGTSTATDQIQQAAAAVGGGGVAGGGGGGGGGAVAVAAGIDGDGGGGGGGGSSTPPSSVASAAAAAGGGTSSTACAVSVSAAALAQEGSDGLGALKGSSPGGSPYRGSPRGGPTLTRSQTLGPNASSALDEKRSLSRVFNPPKLERKHSSGDLHSRLKTRKILGVGETDNGDIHRSKISQVLGHNEHLYVKLPRGFWSAHVAMGVGVTLEAGLLLLTPVLASRLGLMPYCDDDDQDDTTASRVAGAALAGLCVFVWSLLGTSDKHYARTMLLSMLTYQILSICVTAGAALSQQEATLVQEEGGVEGPAGDEGLLGSRLVLFVGLRAVMCLLCLAYFYSIAGYAPIRGTKPTGFRQPCHIQKDQ